MNENNSRGRNPHRKAFIAFFCAVILFATGFGIGVLANINVHIPYKTKAVAATTVVTTTETTTVPTTVPVVVPTTEVTTTESTTAPTTTTAAAEEDECCLAGLCDTIKGLLGTVFPCLAEEE